MTTEVKQKTFDSIISSIEKVNQNGDAYKNPVLVFPAKKIPNHGQYPVRINAPPETAAGLTAQDITYRVTIRKGNPKKDKDGSTFDSDYFWDLFSIVPANGAAPTAPPAQRPATQVKADADALFPGTSAPTPTAPTFDARDISIMKQVALKAANDYAVAVRTTGETLPIADLLQRASAYHLWLTTGEIPQASAELTAN